MKKNLIFLLSALLLSNFSKGQGSAAVASSYGQNLILNGDAEIDALNRQIYNWVGFPKTGSSDFMQDSYGNLPGEWTANCDEKCGLAPKAGLNYFRFPVDDAYRDFSLTQTIDLSGYKDTLIVRNIEFVLSAYVAGNTCTEHGCANGIIYISFKDKDGKEIESYEEKKDNADFTWVGENEAMKKFEKITARNMIPEGALSAAVSIKAKGGCCNPAYVFFDNVSLIFLKGEKREKKQ